ncbi:MAG: hypothetical protein WBC06_06220 [Chitinophagaceae bacterium]
MKKRTEENEMNEFAWHLLFLVTGLSAFFFNGILVLLDGNSSSLFKWIGISGITIGVLIQIAGKIIAPEKK